MTSIEAMLAQPPFRLSPEDDPRLTGEIIVQNMAACCALPRPMTSVFGMAMHTIDIPPDDPLYRAGSALARDIDQGLGAGDDNAYHNRGHFCEVLLCAVAISALQSLPQRDRALIFVAAVAHDFHHDGSRNPFPYQLEMLAVERMQVYLLEAGVVEQERAGLAALILATEPVRGVAYARECFDAHARGQTLAAASLPQLVLLREEARWSRMAMVLCEADILPSIGLTLEHAELTGERLQTEWDTVLDSHSKVSFIDHAAKDLRMATYFMLNVMTIRQIFSAK